MFLDHQDLPTACGLEAVCPGKKKTLLTLVDLPITFKNPQNNSSLSSSGHKIPWPDSPSLLFASTPMAGNTKDKSVINYLQMISYPLQLFAHQITMPSTAAQMRHPSLAGHSPPAPDSPQIASEKNEAGQTPNQQGEPWFSTPRCFQLFHFLGLFGPHGETGWEALAQQYHLQGYCWSEGWKVITLQRLPASS